MGKHCQVCGEPAIRGVYGNCFCDNHKWFFEFDPEELEMVIIMRLEGKSPKQIERYYHKVSEGLAPKGGEG